RAWRPLAPSGKTSYSAPAAGGAKEELFDIKMNGALVYERVKNMVPAKREIIPDMTHYGVYTPARERAAGMATGRFAEHP
ncbi:MAG: hypothetical protein ACLGJB_24270, partial [Blastocatellia bacterium]